MAKPMATAHRRPKRQSGRQIGEPGGDHPQDEGQEGHDQRED
jgi:hypothetical protein